MKYILLLLIGFLLSGCSHMTVPTGGKEIKILVVTQTRDEFNFVYETDHPLVTFRKKTYSRLYPGWTLSGIFYDFVSNKNNESNYTLVFGQGEKIPTINAHQIHRGHERVFDELAVKYNADHILILRGHGPYLSEYGKVIFDAEYGYQNRIYRHWIVGGDESGLFLHADVILLNTMEIYDDSKRSNFCNENEHYFFIDPVELPDEEHGRINVKRISFEDRARMFDESKAWIESWISNALMNCSIIPDTRLKSTYNEDESKGI